ncbi:unnamed protein product, partial [Closterium sp. NIES-65]
DSSDVEDQRAQVQAAPRWAARQLRQGRRGGEGRVEHEAARGGAAAQGGGGPLPRALPLRRLQPLLLQTRAPAVSPSRKAHGWQQGGGGSNGSGDHDGREGRPEAAQEQPRHWCVDVTWSTRSHRPTMTPGMPYRHPGNAVAHVLPAPARCLNCPAFSSPLHLRSLCALLVPMAPSMPWVRGATRGGREKGVERQFRYNCELCDACIAYRPVPYEQDCKYIYLFPEALTEFKPGQLSHSSLAAAVAAAVAAGVAVSPAVAQLRPVTVATTLYFSLSPSCPPLLTHQALTESKPGQPSHSSPAAAVAAAVAAGVAVSPAVAQLRPVTVAADGLPSILGLPGMPLLAIAEDAAAAAAAPDGADAAGGGGADGRDGQGGGEGEVVKGGKEGEEGKAGEEEVDGSSVNGESRQEESRAQVRAVPLC